MGLKQFVRSISRHVLTVEDSEGLLQGLDLLLALSDLLLVAATSVHARWLQLLVVGNCGIQLLLGALKVGLLLSECLGLILLLAVLCSSVVSLPALSFLES